MPEIKVVFLEGVKTILRPIDIESDIIFMLQWFNDQETLQFLGRPSLPLTVDEERESLKRLSNDRNVVFLVITKRDDGTPIGTMGIHRIDWISRVGYSGACLDRAYWNGGYGTDAKMILLHHAFTRLNLRAIGSSVLANNPRSKAYQEKTGYREIGRRKSWHFRDGEYMDEIFMEVRREDFMKIWNSSPGYGAPLSE